VLSDLVLLQAATIRPVYKKGKKVSKYLELGYGIWELGIGN
jgi:hypothetical protein